MSRATLLSATVYITARNEDPTKSVVRNRRDQPERCYIYKVPKDEAPGIAGTGPCLWAETPRGPLLLTYTHSLAS